MIGLPVEETRTTQVIENKHIHQDNKTHPNTMTDDRKEEKERKKVYLKNVFLSTTRAYLHLSDPLKHP